MKQNMKQTRSLQSGFFDAKLVALGSLTKGELGFELLGEASNPGSDGSHTTLSARTQSTRQSFRATNVVLGMWRKRLDSL